MKRILILLALCLALPVRADVMVIVNGANPVRSISAEEVAALYLGRARTFSSGEFALVFDQPRDSELRRKFFKLAANMAIGQVNTYWSRLMFSGQEMPPQALPTEQAVVDIVRRNPGAIGYVASMPKDPGVRVVLTMKE